MPKNIEIKAKVLNLLKLHEKAKELSGTAGTILKQHDIFYNSINGRLKFRKIEDQHEELIFYDRPDCEGPKGSDFLKADAKCGELNQVCEVIKKAFGVKGEVKKVRTLYMVDQTRIHVDQVENLGNFMELEVMLKDGQTESEGETIANDLMEKLGIQKNDLLAGAYMDMLNKAS